jgi:drug/metabolite transporter (DMT)-like permease
MISLALGLMAALIWGLHDFGVRFVTAKSAALSAFLVVLVSGAVLLGPLSVAAGDWQAMIGRAYGLAALSGLSYVLGGVGLFKAFAIGPVRLVAPIAGSYPMLSVGWAAFLGQPVSLGQWLAVLAIVVGIAVVAFRAEDHGATGGQQGAAMGWAFAGAVGFALTFSFGHAAAQAGSELPAQFVGRVCSALGLGAVLLAIRYEWRIDRAHRWLLAGMGVLDVTALGLVLVAGGLPNPEFAAVTSSIFGIVTIILAWRFLREPMVAAQWLGVAIVFAGIGYLAL